ncbi:MAG: hypothetical protein DRJ97_03670 [Thermoprotei archaeon]|nr:MAG: hypothetical protein DRJ97_03670 [Thermoprotei archaeon]
MGDLDELTLEDYLPKPHPHVVSSLIEAIRGVRLKPVKLRPPAFKLNGEAAKVITGVDGGFQVKELCGGALIVAAAVAYTSPLDLIEDREPVVEAEVRFEDLDEPATWTAEALERRLMFRASTKACLAKKPEVVLIDGGLLPHPSLLRSEAGRAEVEACVAEQARFMKLAEGLGVNVAGVVKRARGKLFDGVHRDVALLDLEEGEATEPRPIEEGWVRRVEGLFRRVGFKPPRIMVSYVKTTANREPVRIELPDWCDLGLVLSTVARTADPVTGVPIHVVKADSYTKVHGGVVKAVYTRLLHKLVAEYGLKAEDYLRPIRGESLEEG